MSRLYIRLCIYTVYMCIVHVILMYNDVIMSQRSFKKFTLVTWINYKLFWAGIVEHPCHFALKNVYFHFVCKCIFIYFQIESITITVHLFTMIIWKWKELFFSSKHSIYFDSKLLLISHWKGIRQMPLPMCWCHSDGHAISIINETDSRPHWGNSYSISFQIEWDMTVVTGEFWIGEFSEWFGLERHAVCSKTFRK